MPFIKITSFVYGSIQVVNVDTISRIEKLKNGRADIFWTDGVVRVETKETFDEVVEAIQIATHAGVIPAKPEPSSYESDGLTIV